MRSLTKFLFLLGCCLLFSWTAVLAQPGDTSALPFAPGETMTYEAKISRLKISITVADLEFSLDKIPDSPNYLIRTSTRSKGTLLKIFRYSFLQEFESIVDFPASRIIKTTKHDVQKDRVRNSVAEFDYLQNRVIFVETDPKNSTRPPRRIASKIGDEVYDLVSAIYSLRTLPLAVGKSFEVTMSDSGLVYNIPVRVTGREQQKSILGKQLCWRIEPQIFGKGRVIEQKGNMTMWFTDDDRRLPVRALMNTTYGKIDVRLKSVNNSKLTP